MNGKLIVSNLGDSSALLVRNNRMTELNNDQVPPRPDEQERIKRTPGG